MGRNYLVFGSDDGLNWELFNTVLASGAPQALNKGREQEKHRHYAAVPERNWAAMTPEVEERPPVVRWKSLNAGQMTFEEKQDTSESAIEEAKEAMREALGMDEEVKEKEEVA